MDFSCLLDTLSMDCALVDGLLYVSGLLDMDAAMPSTTLFFLILDFRSLAESFKRRGFVIRQKRSIHDNLSMLFLTLVLSAGVWQEDILRNSQFFEWHDCSPSPYCENNNRSALDNLQELKKMVCAWEAGGFVERVPLRPHSCNPMTVAVQYNTYTEVTKYRPCIDLSCYVNKHIKPMTVKLDDLSVAQEMISQGDFMTAFDLENQFFSSEATSGNVQVFGLHGTGFIGSRSLLPVILLFIITVLCILCLCIYMLGMHWLWISLYLSMR